MPPDGAVKTPLVAFAWLLAACAPAVAQPALTPPDPRVLSEARALVSGMEQAERGPYSRLRWYCNDGAVLPPDPYACVEHGGGRQHAEYSADRQRLHELGWSVGTVVAALTWDELWEGERHLRLRELPLERYLVDVLDGWVLRRARYYRGRVQVEDEEAVGRELLLRLLAQRPPAAPELLLAREAARALPHHGGADRTRTVRRLAQEIAERDPTFERLRIKIHTAPEAADAARVRQWLAARPDGAASVTEAARSLAAEIDAAYGERAWLTAARRALSTKPAWQQLQPLLEDAPTSTVAERLAHRARALRSLRDLIETSADPATSLAWLDLSFGVEAELLATATTRLAEPQSRSELLTTALDLVDATYGVGLLSPGERAALRTPLLAIAGSGSAASSAYADGVSLLRRAPLWCAATVRYSFAEALVRYGALEPDARRFVDDLLRGSPALALAETATRLARDADQQMGLAHRVFGRAFGGMLGLNPGLATGRLRVITPEQIAAHAPIEKDAIVLLPRTVSELPPVAGILTLAEGNLLSHMQLLARNLGIPNASVSARAASEIAGHEGEQVLLVVGPQGSIVLEPLSALPAAVSAAIDASRQAQPALEGKLQAPPPDLGVRRLLPLAELGSSLAGKVVGPKAANLGELARLFPGRVAPAIALPFGIFAEHTSRGGDQAPRARLVRAYQAHRDGELDDPGLARELVSVRTAIRELRLEPPLREELRTRLAELLGPEGSYGVFVRSDTNVEDLPGFTGAGLNETIPNVVGFDNLLAAISRVWSSAFSERAVAWRSALLERPEEVYTSVLIMRSVPADKSGVMVTSDLVASDPKTHGQGLTVATAWGMGGAVDGDAAETLLLRADGRTLTVSEAKAPYKRRPAPTGGIEWVAASSGPVLTIEEQAALRELGRDVASKLSPLRDELGQALPWDIEFGFVGGQLSLFQIRPLVERGQALGERALAMLVGATGGTSDQVDLSRPPSGGEDDA